MSGNLFVVLQAHVGYQRAPVDLVAPYGTLPNYLDKTPKGILRTVTVTNQQLLHEAERWRGGEPAPVLRRRSGEADPDAATVRGVVLDRHCTSYRLSLALVAQRDVLPVRSRWRNLHVLKPLVNNFNG